VVGKIVCIRIEIYHNHGKISIYFTQSEIVAGQKLLISANNYLQGLVVMTNVFWLNR
jgi:hypothetical protein